MIHLLFKLAKLLALLMFWCCLLCPSACAVDAQGRGIALVVGNMAYSEPLKTTVNDAESIGELLERLGFTVNLQRNLTLGDFENALNWLAQEAAQTKLPVIFYFAGHAIQVNGVNYLIPVDIDPGKPLTPVEVPDKTLSMDKIFEAIRNAGVAPKLVILDACRDNPFAQRTTTDWIPGLAAPTNAPVNTLIAFATDPGNVAADGRGSHSPYTSTLLRAMKHPGVLANAVFQKVGEDIKAVLGTGQTPWVNTSLITPFYFWEPIYLKTKIADGDDEVVVFVNGQESASWNNDGAALRISQLQGASNIVEIKVFNQRSYTGGFPPLGHLPEGWRFAVAFYDGKDTEMLRATGAEDRPQDNGPRHGKLFTAAKFTIEVNVETGKVQLANVDLDYWKHPARGIVNCDPSNHPFARGHCAVEQCPSGQWVRGTVGLTRDGAVLISQNLETDRVDLGICGSLRFDLLNHEGKTVAAGRTPTRCIPGKVPGPARISDVPLERVDLPSDYALSVTSIRVAASCGADNLAPFGSGGRADEPGPSLLELHNP